MAPNLACIASVLGVPSFPLAMAENMGTPLMDSTPPAMTTSCVPDMTACAAKWIACCELPHWRSTVVPGTVVGRRSEDSTTPRPTLAVWLPTCETQPMITSSTRAPSASRPPTSASTTAAPSAAGCMWLMRPLRRPPAVRFAATMKARGEMAICGSVVLGVSVLWWPQRSRGVSVSRVPLLVEATCRGAS